MAATVVDLFSGGGGASAGFAAHPAFSIVGAADAQMGKPSSSAGSLRCNSTYEANMGFRPVTADLSLGTPDDIASLMNLQRRPDVLIACPPCTGFSRTLAANHTRDDPRNNLVRRTALFVEQWMPQVLIMENAREVVMGRFKTHLDSLVRELRVLGYTTRSEIHTLDKLGLPQARERAIVVATRDPLPALTLGDLWRDHEVDSKATHVRRAIWDLPALKNGQSDPDDPAHIASTIRREVALQRTQAIPHDGGSWLDLRTHPDKAILLTPAMRARLSSGNLGSYPDVYGRMYWDRPAPTIKRECSHVGNGRYTHPEQDRLCSVREMASLNGFPAKYQFVGGTNNMYRHVGDAVPPLVSYQLAWLVAWILGGNKPAMEHLVLPGTSLSPEDIRRRE